MTTKTKPSRHQTAADSTAAVDELMNGLVHPQKATIEALREVMLSTDPSMREGVKWNAPSFRTGEYFATVHLRAKAGVVVILHFGAKAREVAAGKATIADPDGLLTWLAKDRASVTFADGVDLARKRGAFAAILRQWIAHV
jgi:hypothetical protein